jgi:lipopolysaccharide transport system ATP-binding protein
LDSNVAIKVENLSKLYALRETAVGIDGKSTNDLWALKEVSFEIKKGESVGIIGPNGSGKSTLLKILAGITKPTAGKVTIKGKVASILDIGAGFHPELSGRENIFLNGQLLGFSKKEIQSHYEEIVEFSGIVKFIDQPVKNYSNGMYLRLAFSIMVHLDFDVYLFDEVMSVGDAEFVLKSREKLEEFKSSKKTTIFVSHNFSELGNQELFMQFEKGKLLFIGNDLNIFGNYNEKTLQKIGEKVHYSRVLLDDFSSFNENRTIKIEKIELYQNENEFRTDRETHFVILFKNDESFLNTDFVIKIFDVNGNVVSTVASIFTKAETKLGVGLHQFSFVFPPNYFGLDLYSIRIHVVNDVFEEINEDGEKLVLDDKSLSSISKSHFLLPCIIYFKMNFLLKEKIVESNEHYLRGGLLPIFTWTKTKVEIF